MKKSKLKILVSGMMAGDPYQGGATWAVLQYVLGFRRLGHDVWFVEPVKDATGCADYFQQVVTEFDLTGRATLNTTDDVCDADLLLNISGMLTDEALLSRIPVRVYLDIDPGFNQLWHAAQGINMRFAGHTNFVTIGLAIGRPECPVPTCGLPWITTLQPIVLEHWPVANVITHDALTTIGNWRGYGSVEQAGVFYGQKAHSLRPFFALPMLTPEKFLLAMSIHPDEKKDLAALVANGWQLMDPRVVARSPASYREFIQQSKAEFGIAKSGYVASRCGWFSDRSVCYLASGRPVIAQETGFSRFLPTGKGLHAFQTTEDVLTAIAAINSDYQEHARMARAIAEEHFDSDRVLTKLLEKLG
jgi:hypothetical protein